VKQRIVTFIAVPLLALSSALAQETNPPHNYKPSQGYVPNAETAIRIALAVWEPIYGKKQIDSEKRIEPPAGGYISARRITPNSVLHPVLAAILVALLCVVAFARGKLGLLPVGIIGAAAIAAAISAFLARMTATPPNNRWKGP
jgi:hypothetical protein